MPNGRPPKPTALKILEGNPGKRGLNSGEPKPPPGPISPPSWLRGRSRTAWKWVAPVLEQMGVLRTADVHALALLCDAYAEYIECAAVVRKLGRTYESKGGISRPRPEVQMATEGRRQVIRMMTEFGMTSSSRVKLFVAAEEAPADPFEQWERGNRRSS